MNPEKVIVPEEVNPVRPVRVPAAMRLAALAVRARVPPGASLTSPVLVSPKVKVCLAVVDRIPVAVRYAPPAVPAETEAVGVPELIFNTANLAKFVVEALVAVSFVPVLLKTSFFPLI